jgi:DNA processing protein
MDARAYWVAFNTVKGIGAVRLRLLLDHFGDLEVAWHSPSEAYRAAGISQKVVERIQQRKETLDIETYWKKVQDAGIYVLTWDDDDYPNRLRKIDQPPPVLYTRGKLTFEDEWAVSIVGTRRVTAYGRRVTEDLAGFLARNGITIISGLARGVDTIAHRAALDSGGRSIAVLGCGVDTIYPPENRALAEDIINDGSLVSDYAPGVPPDARNFPPRNRIIAGLGLATVVVEAGDRSGALITAEFAVDQGREVFAVPGPIYAPQSKGTNKLIQQGAQPYLSSEELLELLNIEMVDEQKTVRTNFELEPFEREILKLIADESLHIDEICVQSQQNIDKISATLVIMELKGLVQQDGNMNYQAIMEPPVLYDQGDDEE